MTKRALLIGCNYKGTKAELHGCVNDVKRMYKCLISRFGFREEDVTIMIDTDKSSVQPTGVNIKKVLAKLIDQSQPGDIFVLHYSGHGTQVPAESGDEEDDGFDEAIVPSDLNLLTDDDFRLLFNNIRRGVKFTFISDSCHSGGLIDQEKEQIGGTGTTGGGGLFSFLGGGGRDFERGEHEKQPWKQHGDRGYPERGYYEEPKPHRLHEHGKEHHGHHHHHHHEDESETETGPRRSVAAATAVNKSLSVETLAEMLSQRTGHDVQVGNIRTSLFDLFGEDSSPTVKIFVNVVMDRLKKQGQNGGGSFWGTMGGLAVDFLKAKISGDDGVSASSVAAASQVTTPAVSHTGHAGAKPEADLRVALDVGVLVSGCMSSETSADANPTGDPAKAYGALSNGIQEVLADVDGSISNGDLVRAVRHRLSQEGFSQHPCLYCSDPNVDALFIC